MLIACPNCGGTADIQKEAIQTGLATCEYCAACIVVATSEHPLQQQIDKEKKKLIIRRKADSLSVTGRRPFGGGGRLDLRECIVGGIAAMAVFPYLVSGGSGFLGSILAALVVFLLVGVIASFFRFYSPPVVLTQFELKPGLLGATDFLREEIRQIYAAATIFTTGQQGDTGTLHNNVCVLTRQGCREIVFGPAKSIAMALAVEQILETELGLYNLRVKGDERSDTLDSPLEESPQMPVKSAEGKVLTTCEVCAAKLEPTSADWDKGYTNCFYCDHLFALYDGQAQEVILGEDSALVRMQQSSTGELVVQGQLRFTIDPGSKEVRLNIENQSTPEIIPFSEIRGVCVRTVGGLDLSGGTSMMQRMKEAQARSGEVSVNEIYGAALMNIAKVSYSVLLQMKSGFDRVLVAELTDANFALQLKGRMQSFIKAR